MKTIEIKTREGIEEILSRARICFLGVTDLQGNPYVVPMNFGYCDGIIYLHSGPENSIISMLQRSNYVCITFSVGDELVYQDKEMGCSYRMNAKSVICRGKVSFIDDMEMKRDALGIIMRHYTDYPASYSDPAVRNVKIWKVKIEKMTAREYAAI